MGWRQPRIGRIVGPVGLDVGHHSIKLAQLEGDRRGLRLAALASRATPPGVFADDGRLIDPAALAAVLRAMAAEVGVAGADVVATVASPAGHVEVLDLMATPGSDLEPPARAALAARLGADLEQAAVSLRVVEAAPHDAVEPFAPVLVRVLACVLPADLVAGVTEAIDGAGLAPLVIEAAPLVAGCLLQADSTPEPLLVGDLGASQTAWTLWRNGLPERVVVADVGGATLTEAVAQAVGADWETAESWKAGDPWDESAPAASAAVAGYVRLLLDGLAGFAEPASSEVDGTEPGEPRWPVGRVVLHGAGAQLRDLAPRLAEATGLCVDCADGFALLGVNVNGSLPAGVRQCLPQWCNCLGLAFRSWVVEG